MSESQSMESSSSIRQHTGVPGLDDLLEGGFPSDSLIVIAGYAGAGKTILASQFAYYGSVHEEPSLYVSFAENERQYFVNMKRIGLDFKNLIDSKKFRFVVMPTSSREGTADVLDAIIQEVISFKAKRLVIDSFSALALGFETSAEGRAALQIILGKLVREHGCTTLLIVEIQNGSSQIGLGFEEFVADGVIELRTLRLQSGQRRAIFVDKMRGTKISLEPSTYSISDDGMTVFPAIPVRTVMGLQNGRTVTGISGFDEIIEGGLIKGSITSLIGATGTGKTTFGLEFLYNGAKDYSEKGLYISFEEPNEQLRFSAKSVGYTDFYDLWNNGVLTVETITPEQSTLDGHLLKFRDFLRKTKATRVVVDDLNSVEQSCDTEREFYLFVKKIVQLVKEENHATLILNLTTNELAGITMSGANLSTIMDNLILFRYVEIESHMTRAMIFLKTSATASGSPIRKFEITSNGIKVDGIFDGYSGLLTGIPSILTGPGEVSSQSRRGGSRTKE
jgi:circadian clock protein KaiC